MILASKQTFLVQFRCQTTIPHEIHVVAGVDGVLVLVLPELQGEQGVLPPGHVLLHLDLRLFLGQPREPLPPDAAEVDLRQSCDEDSTKIFNGGYTVLDTLCSLIH